jgi:hypothetical protein
MPSPQEYAEAVAPLVQEAKETNRLLRVSVVLTLLIIAAIGLSACAIVIAILSRPPG